MVQTPQTRAHEAYYRKNKQTKLMLDYYISNMDVRKKLQIVKLGFIAHMFSPTAKKKIYKVRTVSRWTTKISITDLF